MKKIIFILVLSIASIAFGWSGKYGVNGYDTGKYGVGVWGSGGTSVSAGDALILESGDYLLLESGDKLLLE